MREASALMCEHARCDQPSPANVPNVASVVPCQAGVSVLLRPHGPDVANVLPAVQKIAQRGEKRGIERESGAEE